MLTRIHDVPEGAIGFAASGRISMAESHELVAPEVERMRQEAGRVRLLYLTKPDFAGYEVGMLDDAVFGTRHFTHFEKIAFVGEGPHDRAVRAIEGLMPAGLKVFAPGEIDAAKAWLEG